MEWLAEFKEIESVLLRQLGHKDMEVLIPGCGNSSLPIHLLQLGYQNLTCIDFSENLITEMQQRYEDLPIDWVNMDARALDLPSNCCDAVVDKALLDCISCHENAAEEISRLQSEVFRVLKKGGLYIVFSNGKPGTRLPYFENSGLEWETVEAVSLQQEVVPGFQEENEQGGLDTTLHYYFFYVFQKRAD